MKKIAFITFITFIFLSTINFANSKPTAHIQPKLPDSIYFEEDSRETFLKFFKMKQNVALTGIMDLETGEIFLLPVIREEIPGDGATWSGTWDSPEASLLGRYVQPLEYKNGIHKIFAEEVDNMLDRPFSKERWIGFGINKIIKDGKELFSFAGRSRSLNNSKFKVWIGGDIDSAFKSFHQRFNKLMKRKVYEEKYQQLRKEGYFVDRAKLEAKEFVDKEFAEDQIFDKAPDLEELLEPMDLTHGNLSGKFKKALVKYTDSVIKKEFCVY